MQLDFFRSREESEAVALREGQAEIKRSLDKIRRGTYAEINQLKRVCVELSARQDVIERGMCQASWRAGQTKEAEAIC